MTTETMTEAERILALARDYADQRIMASRDRATSSDVEEAYTALQSLVEARDAEIKRLKMVSDTDKASADHWRGECERLKKYVRELEDAVTPELVQLRTERDALRAELAAIRAQAEGALGYLNKWQKNGGTKAGYEFVDKAIALLAASPKIGGV